MAVIVFAVPAGAGAVAVQSYLAKRLRSLAPYPPGALIDLLVRAIGKRQAAARPVMAQNKPRVNGMMRAIGFDG